jgi:hypothetical protein
MRVGNIFRQSAHDCLGAEVRAMGKAKHKNAIGHLHDGTFIAENQPPITVRARNR